MVRYPISSRTQISDIESMWVAAGDGTLVPFSEVARIQEGRTYASIKRKDQKRTVTITADVDRSSRENGWLVSTALRIFRASSSLRGVAREAFHCGTPRPLPGAQRLARAPT